MSSYKNNCLIVLQNIRDIYFQLFGGHLLVLKKYCDITKNNVSGARDRKHISKLAKL